MGRNAVEQSINLALSYIRDADLLISQSTSTDGRTYDHQTIFGPSLMLGCLPSSTDLAQFLLRQKSITCSFNYWDRSSPEYKSFLYPDDLDDTFCALIALYKHNPNLINSSVMASVVKLLIAAETKPGGPYKTWLTADPDWQDVDIAVNANIACFLSLASNRLCTLDAYLADCIDRADYRSPYYPTNWPIYYYLARACPASHRRRLSRHVQADLPTISNSLQTALALNALCNLSVSKPVLAKLQKQLVEGQQPDGSWPAAPYCLDPSRDGQLYYNGSASLTTAFAIEALTASQKRLAKSPNKIAKPASKGDRIHQAIIRQAMAEFSKLEPSLAAVALQFITKLAAADTSHQITLLPYKFAQSLAAKPSFNDQFYIDLGLANLYGWVAYTFYDDFLDDEGRPAELPIANIALRRSLQHFMVAFPDPAFQAEVNRTFDIIDTANAWEIANCRNPKRLPNYGDLSKLAERSLGHGLTPLAVLLKAGHQLDDSTVLAICQAFKHYLITRQLDDDAHDWVEDYQRGQINYVVASLLKEAPGLKSSDLQSHFWHTTLLEICKEMTEQISKGRQAIDGNPLLKPTNILTDLFGQLEKSVGNTRKKHRQAKEFLDSFSPN